MPDKRISVDEPLISTDVDGLIRTVAERGKIPLAELQQICRIDKKNFDKWVRVLEDEGYIAIEYGLRGTTIIWKGREEYGPEAGAPAQAEAPAVQDVQSQQAAPPAQEEPEEAVVEPAAASEPEELLSQYLARKRAAADAGARPTSVEAEKTVQESTKPAAEPDVFSVSQVAPAQPDTAAAGEAGEAVESEAVDEPIDEADEPALQAVPAPSTREPFQKAISLDTRELVSAYMDEIAKEKAKIAELKKEKERLYRDKFASIEGRLEADMVTLTGAVLEKQTKIAELKERVLELPDKVDELEKLQAQMNRLREEGRGALERTRQKADSFLHGIEESKGAISSKVDSLNSLIGKESDSVRELERMQASVGSRLTKLQATSDALKGQIDELNEAMDGLMDDIGKTSELKTEIAVLSASLKETVGKHGGELDSLEAELEGISRIEHWVKEYVSDYEKKIEGIEQYVAKSDDELSTLREAAEDLYMNKYLGELHDLTEAYQGELDGAIMKEKDIEQRIADSRGRISELVRDSQEMIRKVRSEPSVAKDFASASELVRERTARIKATLEEKEKERAKLLEDAGNVRKTPAPGRAVSSSVRASSSRPSRSQSRGAPARKKKK